MQRMLVLSISRILSVILFAFLILPARGADQIVMDFESLGGTGLYFRELGKFYEEKGCILADIDGSWGLASFYSSYPYYNGSPAIFNNSQTFISLTRTNGGFFDLSRMDLSRFPDSSSGPVIFYGYRGGALVATESFYLSSTNRQRFTPASLTNVTEIRWKQSNPSHQFDNVAIIPLSTTPMTERLTSFVGAEDDPYVRISLEHLRVRSTYNLQTSTNLSSWTSYSTFQARSGSQTNYDGYIGSFSPRPNTFYRLYRQP